MQQELFSIFFLFFIFTKIVNKPGVDAIKYAALYPKMKVELAK